MKTIEIIVGPDGSSRVETKGFAGPACREATRFIEQALGRSSGEQLTAEFYATSSERQQVAEGNCRDNL